MSQTAEEIFAKAIKFPLGTKKTVLHVGCGPARTPPGYEDYHVLRLDVDPRCKPDYLCSMTDMSIVPDDSVDAVYASHTLEHLHRDDIPIALAEMLRVLHPGGQIHLHVPDLQKFAARIAEGNAEGPCYTSPAGPICALDAFYGHSAQTKSNPHMRHGWGFTRNSMQSRLLAVGFTDVRVVAQDWNLIAKGKK